MADVFVSYARSTVKLARAAADALRMAGYSVWIDDQLPSHTAYADVIAEQLEAARAVLVLWSPDAVASQWVRSEANRGRAQRKLIQVMAERVRLPMPFDQLQYTNLTAWDGGGGDPGWRKILASVDELARGAGPAPATPLDPTPERAVLAVLPFDNLSGDPEMDAFSDGVSEDIIRSVGREPGLVVIGRAASFQHRGERKAGAAQALGATYLLDGAVRRSGGRIRVAAELSLGASGALLWSERYDRDCADLLELQDEIAATVADALGRSLRAAGSAQEAASAKATDAAPPERERRQVSLLYAEVDGLADLADHLEAEMVAQARHTVFDLLARAVEGFEGFVEKTTASGLVGLFGAPAAQEDHAQRACFAALRLMEDLGRFSADLRRSHGLEVSTRVGVASGEVVFGLVGGPERGGYAAQGRVVEVAQRMQALAQPATCIVSPATAALADGYVSLQDLGEFAPPGSPATRLFRLEGLGPSRTRLDVSRIRGLSRFVGRARDLRVLEEALEQTAAGHGQVIGVVAEAGTGKSRLCFEFLQHCRAQGMQVFEARAVAHGRKIPLLPIVDILRAYLGLDPRDDAAATRTKAEARILELDPALAEALPLVLDFLGAPDPARPAPPLPPDVRRAQLIAVIRQMIRRLGELRPVVTMIEDLHWLDPASAEFLEQAIDPRGARSLLLLNFRPEFRADWMGKAWYRQMPLTPLDRAAVGELLGELLGDHPSVAAIVEPIHERTAGNPFFVEELVQSLVETGQIEGPRGARRRTDAAQHLEAPSSVHAVVAGRIDRLSAADRRLLQTAAVIGKDFTQPLLSAVADLPPEGLIEAMERLQAAEFVHETAIWPTPAYAFKHPLTQEVALKGLVHERRRKLHGSVAQAIEAQNPERLDETAALLATHWSEAGRPGISTQWWLRSARHMLRRFAPDEALAQVGHGLAELAKLPEEEPRWTAELELQALAGTSLMTTHGHGAAATAAAFARAQALCEKLPSSPFRMIAEYGVWSNFVHRLELGQGLKLAERMLETAARDDSATWRFIGLRARSQVYSFLGRFRESMADMDEAISDWDQGKTEGVAFLVHDPGVINVHTYNSNLRMFCGDIQGARSEADIAMEQARRSGHHLIVVQCMFTYGYMEDHVGDPDAAISLMEETLAYAVDHGVAYFRCLAAGCLATMVGRAGHAERGLELLRPAIDFMRTSGSRSFMPGFLGREGELLTRLGRADEALPMFEEALDWVARTAARRDEAVIRRQHAAALAALGRADEAEAELRASLDTARWQGAHLFELQGACELAPMLQASGRGAEARDLLRRVVGRFRPEEQMPILQEARDLLQSCGGAVEVAS